MGKIIYLGGYKLNLAGGKESVVDVAKWFLQNNESIPSDSKDGNLKLQKLLYYAQCMHLAVFDTPLYSNQIQAWENGPVIREAYDKYRYEKVGISARAEEAVKIGEFQENILNVVNTIYGSKTANELVELTHREEPWREKIELVKQRCNPEITIDRLKEYYASLKELFEVFSDYSIKEHQYRTGSNVFTYQDGVSLTDADRKDIDEFAYDLVGQSFFVSKDSSGRLVIY